MDWELLLMDDGSTDGTRQLLEEVYGGEPGIRYLYQENGGAITFVFRGGF